MNVKEKCMKKVFLVIKMYIIFLKRMNEIFCNCFNKDIDIIVKVLGGFEEKINIEYNVFKKEYILV